MSESKKLGSPSNALLLPMKEAANRLGICKRSLEREIQKKRIPPPVKIGRRSFIPVVILQAYVDKLIGALPAV